MPVWLQNQDYPASTSRALALQVYVMVTSLKQYIPKGTNN